MPPILFDKKTTAEYCGESETTYVRKEKLWQRPQRCCTIGGHPRWDKADLDAWLAERIAEQDQRNREAWNRLSEGIKKTATAPYQPRAVQTEQQQAA